MNELVKTAQQSPIDSASIPVTTRKRRSRFFRYNVIAMIVLGIIGIFWFYPFLWVTFAAFKTQPDMFSAGARLWPKTWEFNNFARAWIQAKFSVYFFNTVLYAVSATIIVLIKCSLCGYVLARYRFPGRNLAYALIMGTLFIPIATVIIPQFVLVKWLGLLNTRVGVILVLSGGAGALYVLLFIGFFETVPQELFDSATIDGANFSQKFLLVLPMARPIIGTVVIFQFMRSWNEFNIPLVFTLGKPHLRNMAVGMYSFQGEFAFDWTGFAAGTAISVIPVLLVFFAFQNYFVRGMAGAVKG